MTLIDSEKVRCPKCAHVFSTTIYSSVNVSMLPQLKNELLEGKLNQAVCPNCKTKNQIACNILYHDMNNKIMIQILLPEEYSNNKEEAIKEFTKIMREMVSSIAIGLRRHFEKYNYDIVFSLEELKESLDSMEGICNEKIKSITKDVLKEDTPKLDFEHTEAKESFLKKIKGWFVKSPPIKQEKSNLKNKNKVSAKDKISSEKHISILNERISLKYFPTLAMFYKVSPKDLEDKISCIMNTNNIDSRNAMLALEKLLKEAVLKRINKEKENNN